MDQKIKNKIIFLGEQDGSPEQGFKNELIRMFLISGKCVRAYLGVMRYGNETNAHVALCLKTNGNDENLLKNCANIFKSTFSSNEHLDILFLSDEQELVLREVCCPFYTSSAFQIQYPDFYLTSSEGYNLNNIVINCFKRKRLYGKLPDGYMLCDINPSILGQSYGLGNQDINQIVIASRHKGFSLFPISEWPCYVHVARLLNNLEATMYLQDSDIQLIAWGELFKRKEDVNLER
jgi:hypothetical protein